MKIFSGNSNQPLTEKICKYLSIPQGKIYLHQFPSGEQYCQFEENIRGEDVYLIQSTSSPANDLFMQLMIMGDAAKRASAGKLTAVIPYFGYARQDRKDKSRVPISAKLIMDMLAIQFDRIVTMDLHSPQVGGFTNLPFDHLIFKPVLIDYVKALNIDVVVSPDIGAVKRTEEYALAMKKDMAIISKKRNNETDVQVKHFIGEVSGKNVLIVDDITESCGTLIEAAKACKDNGAKRVVAAVTHGCLTEIGKKRLGDAMCDDGKGTILIDNFVHSDTIKCEWPTHFSSLNITELSVSEIFGKAISNINRNQSVSELFK